MIIMLTCPPETKRKIDRDRKIADRRDQIFADGLFFAAQIGRDGISELLILGQLDIRAETQRPGEGMADSLRAALDDPQKPLASMYVDPEHPAYKHARFLESGGETGGHIYPRTARALAVPISEEAKRHTSPRDMADLTLISRKGKPPLLVRMLAARGARKAQWQIHWVLLKHVFIRPRRWFTKGAAQVKDEMAAALGQRVGERLRKW